MKTPMPFPPKGKAPMKGKGKGKDKGMVPGMAKGGTVKSGKKGC